MKDELKTLIDRLKPLGIELELVGNFPWIYLTSVNGKMVTEVYWSDHAYTIAMSPINMEQELKLKDRRKTFKLIRKYLEM